MTLDTQADPDLFGPGQAEGAGPRKNGGPRRRPEGRGQAVTTALLVLLLLAGDLLVALQLPVRESTCTDRLCGPALPVAGGAVLLGVLGVVVWLAGDRRRERRGGTWPYWVALLPAAAPWAFVALHLQWW